MPPINLDDVDRGILYMLQEDARNNVAASIAEEVGVSPNTVRSRIERLEDAEIIQGYHPHINYEKAGYLLHVIFVCSVPISNRAGIAEKALGIEGVVEVTEILSGHQNLSVKSLGENSDDITAIAEQLEELGVEIFDERFIKRVRPKPFSHFGREIVEE